MTNVLARLKSELRRLKLRRSLIRHLPLLIRAPWLEKPGGGGGDREGSSPPGPINSISWVGPGEQIYNENGLFLLLLGCFSAIAVVVYVVLGPLRHLGTLFLKGPQGLVPSSCQLFSVSSVAELGPPLVSGALVPLSRQALPLAAAATAVAGGSAVPPPPLPLTGPLLSRWSLGGLSPLYSFGHQSRDL